MILLIFLSRCRYEKKKTFKINYCTRVHFLYSIDFFGSFDKINYLDLYNFFCIFNLWALIQKLHVCMRYNNLNYRIKHIHIFVIMNCRLEVQCNTSPSDKFFFNEPKKSVCNMEKMRKNKTYTREEKNKRPSSCSLPNEYDFAQYTLSRVICDKISS